MRGDVSLQVAVARTLALADMADPVGIFEVCVMEHMFPDEHGQVDVIALVALGVLVSRMLKKGQQN